MDFNKTKLYLGCGENPKPGYINVDFHPEALAEVYDDIVTLTSFEEGTIDEILSEHALEHLSFADVTVALTRWYGLLTVPGRLVIEVPDFKQLCYEFVMYDSILDIPNLKATYPTLHTLVNSGRLGIYEHLGRMRNIFGLQDREGQFHRSGWWKERLSELLHSIGFKDIRVWRSVEFSQGGFFSPHAQEEPVVRVEAMKW